MNSDQLLDFDTLDDWLEDDLRESGLLTSDCNKPLPTPTELLMASPVSECTPRMEHLSDASTPLLKYEPLTPINTPKVLPKQDSSAHLEPFFKALAMLGSIQQQNNTKRQRSESLDDPNLTNEELIVLKRQRNTDAARRSRQRKAMRMEALEKKVAELETSNDRLRLRAAIAESEKANIQAKEKNSTVRILELEKQLADAHRILLTA